VNHLHGWERLWLVVTVVIAAVLFPYFLGERAIYDTVVAPYDTWNSAWMNGPAREWLLDQKAEWGSRCIPGTWSESLRLKEASFDCYSIAIDGGGALLGAVGVIFVSYVAMTVTRWVLRGFKKPR
jgi:hypothetical protein